MIINATQIRVGMILVVEKELYRVTWTFHRTPGKGNACMQTKLKEIQSGKNLEKRFMSNEKVEKADLENRTMQYLYAEPEGVIVMDNETFDQIQLSNELLGDSKQYLIEASNYSILMYDEKPIGLELPKTIHLKVKEAAPSIKKATVTTSLKPVTLENGLIVNVPGFIKAGDMIKVNTETNEYLERVQS